MRYFWSGIVATGFIAIIVVAAIVLGSRTLTPPRVAAEAPAEKVSDDNAKDGCIKGHFLAEYPDGTLFKAMELYLCGDDMKYTNDPKGARIYNEPQDID